MSLFDRFKKKASKTGKIESQEEVPALGWDAITAEMDRVYVG